jgi:hypothetical protein
MEGKMILTEEEAKKKWCPHTRLYQSNITQVFNRAVTVDKDSKMIASYDNCPGARCIGSQCMAWTWVEPKNLRDIDLVTGDIEPASRQGRCGLCS